MLGELDGDGNEEGGTQGDEKQGVPRKDGKMMRNRRPGRRERRRRRRHDGGRWTMEELSG